MRAARRPWSSGPFGVAADRRLGPAARRRVRADQGNGRPWRERPRRIALSCQGSRRARASRTPKAIVPVFIGRTSLSAHRYLRSLAYLAVAPLLSRSAFEAPASTLSFFRISSIGLWDTSAQERHKNPVWAPNEKWE